ncbi:(spotted green pufferfish) hypothetical protein [Aphelenchoides bicaudatus]|nr:(spotted green pufferfish) hypothetical protein [Aphelenchoides bicaudatus]
MKRGNTDKVGDLIIVEEINAESEPRGDFNLIRTLNLKSEDVSTSADSPSTLAESVESPVRRKRGRKPNQKVQKSPARRSRLNPDRAARHRQNVSLEYCEDEEMAATLNAYNVRRKPQKKARKKRSFHTQVYSFLPKPKGRPKKDTTKPVCVVKPVQPAGTDNKQRNCNWSGCSYVTNSVRSLKTHVEREHLHHMNQFVCRWDNCTRTAPFKALYMLSLHLRSHMGDRPFECRICGKTYTRQENLRTHTRKHNNERPFRCSVCQKAFMSSSDRGKHQSRTHTDEKNYKCPVNNCVKRYTDPSSLRKHLKTVHGEEYYIQAKLNKQLNGPGNNYGTINLVQQLSPVVDLSDQPSTSRGIGNL